MAPDSVLAALGAAERGFGLSPGTSRCASPAATAGRTRGGRATGEGPGTAPRTPGRPHPREEGGEGGWARSGQPGTLRHRPPAGLRSPGSAPPPPSSPSRGPPRAGPERPPHPAPADDVVAVRILQQGPELGQEAGHGAGAGRAGGGGAAGQRGRLPHPRTATGRASGDGPRAAARRTERRGRRAERTLIGESLQTPPFAPAAASVTLVVLPGERAAA